MDRAGSDDNEEAALVGISAMSNGAGLISALKNRFPGSFCQGDLML